MDFKLVFPSIYINFDIQTKFEVNQTNSLKNVGGVGFLVNDTWAKWGFEIWPLW